MKDRDVSCTCARCAAACRHIPGLFHPLEALRAIRAGRSPELMCVGYFPGWDGHSKTETRRIDALMPLSINPLTGMGIDAHNRRDTFDARGVCIFLRLSRCTIHDSGFKPVECRLEYICRGTDAMTDVQRLKPWDTFVGRKVIEIWRADLADPAPGARRRVAARKALGRVQ